MTQALTYVEIDVPHCANVYGFSPCTASLTSSPPTGTIKCFNTRNTCQDIANYVAATALTFRFAKPASYLPREIFAIPSVKNVQLTPAVVSLGKDLGQRASVSVVFDDHRDDDTMTGVDPYLSERPYEPFEQGTFWGKFRARNPFIVGAPLRLIFGYVGQDLEDMETRHYIIDSYEGPNPRGEFTIRASDVLKLSDADKAVAPLPSNGFLTSDINAAVTSITLSPTGVGSEYVGGLYVNIGGSEICSYTVLGDVLTVSRGVLNTTAATHSAGDRVQRVLNYAADPAEIVYDLCVNYVPGFDSSWIDLPTWLDETATYNGNIYTGYVTEPTPVKTLLEEIILQAALALWWDDVNQQLRLQVLHAISTSAFDFTPDNMKRGSLSISENLDSRLSQILIYFGQVNPLLPLDNKDNYKASTLVIDEESEEDWGQPAIKTILSRWIPAAGRTVADRLGEILIGRYKTPPRSVSFDVQRFAETDPVLGGGYHFLCDFVQDETGATDGVFLPIQVTELRASADAYTVRAEEMLFDVPATDLTNRNIIFTFNAFNLNLRTEHDSVYPAPTGAETVTFTIQSGVTIGSHSSTTPAVDVGTWPAGTTIVIVILGAIKGRGGNGGAGGFIIVNSGIGEDGDDGGTALYTRKALTLTYTDGELWGGGGGGGGGGGTGSTGGGGGGGGAGTDVGSPGGATVPGSTGGYTGTDEIGGIRGFGWGGVGHGGKGGDAGIAGDDGQDLNVFTPGGAGGASGAAIDGNSFVTVSGAAGDGRGTFIN